MSPTQLPQRPAQGRRVAVTGMGAVSPNGIGREAFWQATRNGKSGVKRIDRFEVDTLPTKIAGQVVGFDPAEHLPPRELKHVSHAVPMALAAAAEALDDAGISHADLTLAERAAGRAWSSWSDSSANTTWATPRA